MQRAAARFRNAKQRRRLFWFSLLALLLVFRQAPAARDEAYPLAIDRAHSLHVFDPATAIGAGIDAHEEGEIRRLLSRENVALMRSAGLRSLSYRLRTELGGESWHWNPAGTWSDPVHQEGYWVSSEEPGEPITVSYGYRLPRRGNTIDQANDDGYSRITDGSPRTFWKSNPYLAPIPQWVVVDLGKQMPVEMVRISWGKPWAREYRVQYSERDDLSVTAAGLWHDLPLAAQQSPEGGETMVRIAPAPVMLRRFRILMDSSSGVARDGNSRDWRDRAGFSIREIAAGTLDPAGGFHDVVRHKPDRTGQSVVWVSSTDPWHRALDRDENMEQPGLDLIFRDGLTNGRPMLTAVPLLYDSPENAVAELRYLETRGYAVEEVEFGEEPEEQEIPPEMYGALYRKWAAAITALDPRLATGGPSLVLLAPESQDYPGKPDTSWISRWIADMRQHQSLAAIRFFSFEWYPFDDVCAPTGPQLAKSGALLRSSLAQLIEAGVPREIPWYMTEYGFSAFGARAEVELPGAIFNAGTVATFLAWGGAKTFLYGYEPGEILHEKPCPGGWGNNMLFLEGPRPAKLPTYYGARLLTQEWLAPGGGRHVLYPVTIGSGVHPAASSIEAWAAARPDGKLSLLLLNISPHFAVTVRAPFEHDVEAIQYSRAQYRWRAARDEGRPSRNLPPQRLIVAPAGEIALPPYSITVVRGPGD